MAFGAEFSNNSNGTITSVTIAYKGEFWRSSTLAVNTLNFAYGFSGGSITSTNYLSNSTTLIAQSSLNLVGPAFVVTQSALNGNDSGNQTTVSATINGLSWAPGTSLYIRWTDSNDAGNDAGLAVDDFTLTGTLSTAKDVPIGLTDNFTQNDFGGNTTFTSSDNAVFNGTATTVTLLDNVTASALKFDTDGYILAASANTSLTLSTGAITTNGTITSTISAPLAGSSGLTKVGPGTLVLSGANTLDGAVNIVAGQLNITDDSNLGLASNSLVLGGNLSLLTGTSLGSGRAISGAGTIFSTGSTLSLGGNLTSSSLTLPGPSNITLSGAAKTVGTLTIPQSSNLTVTGGELVISTGLVLNVNSGCATLTGPINFGTGSRNLQINGGSFSPLGNFTGGNRVIKSGTGTLDMTNTTFTTAGTATSAGLQIGVQGAAPLEGGTVIVNDITDLGGAQVRINFGTLQATTPLSFLIGVSIGGRADSVQRPTFDGSAITFAGNSSFFAANGPTNFLAVTVNNTTTLSGNMTPTVFPTVGTPIPPQNTIDINGTGTLTISGNASAVLDRIYPNGPVTLVINGSLGGESIQVGSGATLAGGGLFSGYFIPASGSGNSTIPQNYTASLATFDADSTLAPTGTLGFLSDLTLGGGVNTVLSINGPVIDTGYDSIDVSVPAGFTTQSYVLTYGGSLVIDFGAVATSGNYTLFTTGGNVTRSGNFGTVALTGSHVGTLTSANATWSGTFGDKTFSFAESTGVLTVADVITTTALQTWRQGFFGSTANTGNGADSFDFDGDGLVNLLEYATASNPTTANASPTTVAVNVNNNLTLTFNRIADAKLSYEIWASNDLTTGFTATGTVYAGSAADTVTYTDNVALTAGVKRFLQLRVIYTP